MAKKKAEAEVTKIEQGDTGALTNYIKASYPLIYMVTPEENRAELDIMASAGDLKRKLYTWSITEGMREPAVDSHIEVEDPIDALSKARELEDPAIFVFKDCHEFFKVPLFKRHLRDIARDFKQQRKTMVLLSPVRDIPAELERDLVLVEFDLPKIERLKDIFDNLWDSNEASYKKQKKPNPLGEIDEAERNKIYQAAMGLTTNEAESAFAKAMVERAQGLKRKAAGSGKEPPTISKIVMQEKAAAVKKTGILEYFDAETTEADIGGLSILKDWMKLRSHSFSKEARDFGLPVPRGILLVGLPGCGKSLTAKAAASVLGVPLIRFDIGRVFGGLVGQSEENMRRAIQTIEAIGQCVVWIDEMEKAFAGIGSSGSTDSGVTARVFGNFITWMQEKKTPSFIVATVNRIEGTLPPEMLRKGRFDEIFFVNLPKLEEKVEIFGIHINKYGRNPGEYDLDEMARLAQGFSGAECEESIVSALYAAYDNKMNGGDGALKQAYIDTAINDTTPLSVSKADDLKQMAEWADQNAVDASVSKEAKMMHKSGKGSRDLDLK